jgi:hypothetical protein
MEGATTDMIEGSFTPVLSHSIQVPVPPAESRTAKRRSPLKGALDSTAPEIFVEAFATAGAAMAQAPKHRRKNKHLQILRIVYSSN